MKKQIYSFLIDSVKSSQYLFLGSLLSVVLIKCGTLAFPLIFGKLVDLLSNPSTNQEAILWWMGIYFIIAISTFLLNPLQSLMLSHFVQETILKFSPKWMSQLLSCDLHFFSQMNVGKIVKSTDRGILAHEKILHFSVVTILPLFIEICLCLIAVSQISNALFLLPFIILIGPQIYLTKKIIQHRRPFIKAVNAAEDELANELTEVISNGLVIKLENATPSIIQRLNKQFKNYAHSTIKLSFSGSILNSVHPTFSHLIVLATLGVCFLSILKGEISLGIAISIITISTRISTLISEGLEALRFFDQFHIDIKEFYQSLNLTSFDRTGTDLKSVDHIEVLPHQHNRGDTTFKMTSSFHMTQGQKIAVVGPTGGGKTTFLELLAGMNETSRQHILLDQAPLSRLNSQSHLNHIRYCPQSNHILSGLLNEAVYFTSVENQNRIPILKRLGLPHSIINSPKSISDRATNISGGEARRLCLSRILLRPGSINIFDEPTSSLNENIKTQVWDLMFDQLQDQTLVCTTHDYQSLYKFDRVLLIKDCQIVLDQPPEQIQQSQEFKELLMTR